MRSLVYDIIVGVVVLSGLFVVTKVMRANQRYIMGSSQNETKLEQVYLDDATKTGNTVTLMDAYGTFHTLLKNGNVTDDVTRWEICDDIVVDYYMGPTSEIMVCFSPQDGPTAQETEKIKKIEEKFKSYFSNPGKKYKVLRDGHTPTAEEPYKILYMFMEN